MKWCERKQKHCCWAGTLARLRKQAHRPPLPSLLLTNARTLAPKINELQLQIATYSLIQNCCVMIFTETLLHNSITDTAMQLSGWTFHQQDRTLDSPKKRGGGLCIYILNAWCSDSRIVYNHCSPDLECLVVKYWPFHLPREFTTVFILAVYIPPDGNAAATLDTLAIGKLQCADPDGVLVICWWLYPGKFEVRFPRIPSIFN